MRATSFRTRRNQHHAAGALACAQRCSDVAARAVVATVVTRPTVRNARQTSRRIVTPPEQGRATAAGNMSRRFGRWFQRYVCEQTDTLITVLRFPAVGGLIIFNHLPVLVASNKKKEKEQHKQKGNKAVIYRRLRPRCCHLWTGSYLKRPKSRSVRTQTNTGHA